jgi:hypothetical protein
MVNLMLSPVAHVNGDDAVTAVRASALIRHISITDPDCNATPQYTPAGAESRYSDTAAINWFEDAGTGRVTYGPVPTADPAPSTNSYEATTKRPTLQYEYVPTPAPTVRFVHVGVKEVQATDSNAARSEALALSPARTMPTP